MTSHGRSGGDSSKGSVETVFTNNCHLLILSLVSAAGVHRLRAVRQQGISDISVVCSCWSICSLCSESSDANLLLGLLIAVLGTFVLLQMLNVAACTWWRWIQNLAIYVHLIYCIYVPSYPNKNVGSAVVDCL